jgi:hypothetical protein
MYIILYHGTNEFEIVTGATVVDAKALWTKQVENEMFWGDLRLEIFKKDDLIISPGKCEITRQHEQRFEK